MERSYNQLYFRAILRTVFGKKERAIAKEVEDIITRASNDISWEFDIQDTLEFDDPSEEHEVKIIKDQRDIQQYIDDSDFNPDSLCGPGNEA
ncbi:hypothetical protein ABEB36_009259 [Hypothenemus hampei]|uniref:Uncharacterized protein n=1 Tax=Hypothenemus hampei TaxID=57062 RepID=A0ABD1EIQ3_HYPHA